jgi:hypothetical protein
LGGLSAIIVLSRSTALIESDHGQNRRHDDQKRHSLENHRNIPSRAH